MKTITRKNTIFLAASLIMGAVFVFRTTRTRDFTDINLEHTRENLPVDDLRPASSVPTDNEHDTAAFGPLKASPPPSFDFKPFEAHPLATDLHFMKMYDSVRKPEMADQESEYVQKTVQTIVAKREARLKNETK